MWVGDDGRLHTVALPDPSEAMTIEFRESLDALAATDLEALRDARDRAEAVAYESDWSDLRRGSESYVALGPPVGMLHGRLNTAKDLEDVISGVARRCRLDAITLLEAYLDQDD